VVKNEWSYASSPPVCLHGRNRDKLYLFKSSNLSFFTPDGENRPTFRNVVCEKNSRWWKMSKIISRFKVQTVIYKKWLDILETWHRQASLNMCKNSSYTESLKQKAPSFNLYISFIFRCVFTRFVVTCLAAHKMFSSFLVCCTLSFLSDSKSVRIYTRLSYYHYWGWTQKHCMYKVEVTGITHLRPQKCHGYKLHV
jgi:hypothetical protein